MINFEELTAYLLLRKRMTLDHSELAMLRGDHRHSAELSCKAAAYSEIITYIGKYARLPENAAESIAEQAT